VAQNHRHVIRIDGINKDALDQIGNYIDPEAAYPVIVTE
jgi:type I restriction enzyme R subunit